MPHKDLPAYFRVNGPPLLALGVCALAAAGLALGLSFSSSSTPPSTREAFLQPFVFEPNASLTRVESVSFRDTVVPLDGFDYRNCQFDNVTFKYNGTTPVQFQNNLVRGPLNFTTDNPSISSTLAVLAGFGLVPGLAPNVNAEQISGPGMRVDSGANTVHAF